MATIGFVILSHRGEAQLLRLVRTLNRLYDHPPIACHHDFRQSPITISAFPGNVRFVEPHLKTAWAKWSLVAAALAALQLLYDEEAPDWFVLLSAADYPVRSPDAVIAELSASTYDAYLDARPIDHREAAAALLGTHNPKLGHFASAENRGLKWSHNMGAEIWIPIIRRTPRWRLGRYTVRLPFAGRHPYGARFGCFFGDQWLTGNANTARTLLEPTPKHRALQRHLRMRSIPDETYYQTILCNTPGLSINLDNKRFAEWNGGGAHPMELTEAELPEALASGAHFARKFAPDSPVLDRIDEELGIGR